MSATVNIIQTEGLPPGKRHLHRDPRHRRDVPAGKTLSAGYGHSASAACFWSK